MNHLQLPLTLIPWKKDSFQERQCLFPDGGARQHGVGVVLEEDDRQKPENIWRPGPSKERLQLSILFQSKLIMQAGGKDGVERLREWNMAQVRI